MPSGIVGEELQRGGDHVKRGKPSVRRMCAVGRPAHNEVFVAMIRRKRPSLTRSLDALRLLGTGLSRKRARQEFRIKS